MNANAARELLPFLDDVSAHKINTLRETRGDDWTHGVWEAGQSFETCVGAQYRNLVSVLGLEGDPLELVAQAAELKTGAQPASRETLETLLAQRVEARLGELGYPPQVTVLDTVTALQRLYAHHLAEIERLGQSQPEKLIGELEAFAVDLSLHGLLLFGGLQYNTSP